MGSECRVEGMIIGSEKLVCYIHHSVTEGSHKVKDSEPEAMALMNIGEEPTLLVIPWSSMGRITSTSPQGQN